MLAASAAATASYRTRYANPSPSPACTRCHGSSSLSQRARFNAAYRAVARSMDSLAPHAADISTSGWTARIPVRISAPARFIPNSARNLRKSTIARAPQNTETMVPANALDASTGTSGESSSSGIVESDGRGFQTKPMAARCGSRLKTT